MDISLNQINEALEKVGFQEPEYRTNSKGKKYKVWNLTKLGESHGKLLLQSARNSSKTVSSIRWQLS